MQKIGKGLWTRGKAMREKCRNIRWEPYRWLKLLAERLRNEAWLRCTLAGIIALCGIAIMYYCTDETKKNSAGGARLAAEESDVLEMRRSNRLDIRGMETALQPDSLQNPFSPDHTYRIAPLQSKTSRDKPIKAQGEADSAGRHTSAAPEAAAAAQNIKAEQPKIYLQGIIDMDGTPGALLNFQGKDKFLLAGESWQGYTLDSVEENAVLLSGNKIAIGEALML